MSDINQEELIKKQPIPVSLEGTEKILFQMKNCICKIVLENGEIGTGFFCKIPFNDNLLPVLITNNHIVNKNDLDNNKIIKIMTNYEIKAIELDNLRKKYTDENIDITIIEIKQNEDGIYNYLEIDDIINGNEENIVLEYENESIYILHYPNSELSVSYGLINDIIDNKKINNYCNTSKGSLGSPILSLKTFKVIGIHCGIYSIKNELNYGTFIKYAIDEFNKYNKFKDEISIIYKVNEESIQNIFGEEFVKNNKNNIELIINENKNELVKEYKLRKGENNIKIIININIYQKIMQLNY